MPKDLKGENMKFLKRLKSGNFWISMISAVVLILQSVFDIEIKTEYLNQIILGILGILVMCGIVSESPSEELAIKREDVSSMLDKIGDKICNALSVGSVADATEQSCEGSADGTLVTVNQPNNQTGGGKAITEMFTANVEAGMENMSSLDAGFKSESEMEIGAETYNKSDETVLQSNENHTICENLEEVKRVIEDTDTL